MLVTWGSYAFNTNGVSFTSRTRLVLADTGRPMRYVRRLSLEGWLEADGQSALSTAEAALKAALLIQYQDLKILTDASATTTTSLLNSESISGVRVVDGPHFTGTDGAEYATLRRFAFDVEAEYLISGTQNAVLSWTESVSIVGTGGPVKRFRVPVNGRPVRQVISPYSIVRATQSGQAIGHTSYPTPPPPLWPSYELLEQRQPGNRQNPQRLGRGFANYPISWSYSFEADVPLVGLPGKPPL